MVRHWWTYHPRFTIWDCTCWWHWLCQHMSTMVEAGWISGWGTTWRSLEWHLKVNRDKTKYTKVVHKPDQIEKEWRSTRKLGFLLRDEEDVARRKQLASAAFPVVWSLWKRQQLVSERLRIRLYNAFVLPVLLYNCGCWSLTVAGGARLDSFHQRQLRSLLGIKWPQRLSNTTLYIRCQAEKLTTVLRRQRWKLLGHILRMDNDVPAVQAMHKYFNQPHGEPKWRGWPRTTLPLTLQTDQTTQAA